MMRLSIDRFFNRFVRWLEELLAVAGLELLTFVVARQMVGEKRFDFF